MIKAKFIKAVKTKQNPKKENASWTIINFFIPDANEGRDNETPGALPDAIMIKNDDLQWNMVKGCRFGDELELEAVPSWVGNRQVTNYVVIGVTVGEAKLGK